MRRALLLLASLVAAGALAGPAAAADEQFAVTRAQVARANALVDQAVAAARAGDRERAYDLARTAYLDHFELAEVPLRLRDPNLVLDLEFRFAELRNGIRDGAPLSELRGDAAAIHAGLRDVDRTLASKGVAAPLLAFLFSFTILFREGVEVVLLLAVLLGALSAGRASNYRKPLAAGVGAAIVATGITWLLATLVLDIAPMQRELLEGVTAVAAVVVLFMVSFWIVARLDQRHWMEFMRARVAAAITAGSALAFAGLGFTAVYREGFETVLFYQALAIFAEGLTQWVVLGVVTAAAALAVVAYAILKLGTRLPLKPMLITGASILLLLSVAFAGNAVRSLQEGDWIAVTPIASGWARLPFFVAELTGIHPTRQGIAVQAVLLATYVLGAVWVFGIAPRRRRPAPAEVARVMTGRLRVGVDVGGTFTKAVAVETRPLRVRARAVVPTTHDADGGVADGVAAALRELLAELGEDRARVALVAFSTTQAMNALLEGDVGRVGVVGIGARPSVRAARKRTRVGEIALAPGRKLSTEQAFLDATDGLTEEAVDGALAALAASGCTSVAVSGALSVDDPRDEAFVVARAHERGLPACAGHDLTGAYGLETRTVSAAVNASILPIVERTAAVVGDALVEAGLDVPLLVLRGDGGAMSVAAFRRRPSLTIGSGPAAGVAAAIHQLRLEDAIVVECGGTSTNVSVVKGGRPVLRSLRVMDQPTCIRAVDSWVVGAAGGSMALVGRRGIAEVGPRSAHVAGLPYACFAEADELRDVELELAAPRAGDPEAYATLRSGEQRWALTTTCAANALGLVPTGAHAHASRNTALAALEPLAARLRTTAAEAARRVLDGAVDKIARAVAEAARQHGLGSEVPLVALGGAGAALVPAAAERLRRPVLQPADAEVLSSIGAAVSLVRAEIARTAPSGERTLEVVREAELACVACGAAPATVTVETCYDDRDCILRAVATGAVALEVGVAHRDSAGDAERLGAAATALGLPADALELVAETGFYQVYSENGSGRVAAVDGLGAIALAEDARRVVAVDSADLVDVLQREVAAAARNLGVATLMPRVSLVAGSRVIDLSDARRPEDVARAARTALAGHSGPAVAVVAR